MSPQSQNLLIGKRSPIRPPKHKIQKTLPKKKTTQRVGETDNFIIDCDDAEGLILLYGKEASSSHRIKLGLDKAEATAVIDYLRQAKLLFT
jgi:hypothetical protein